jgi:hypothetical protein
VNEVRWDCELLVANGGGRRDKLGRRSYAAARRSGQEQRSAGLTRSARPAAELQNPEVQAELNGAFASASGSVLPVASSARFRRRVRVQANRPRASRLRANGVRAVQEQCAGDATGRGDPAGG